MSHPTFKRALLPGNIRQFVEETPGKTGSFFFNCRQCYPMDNIHSTQTDNTAGEDSSMLTISKT